MPGWLLALTLRHGQPHYLGPLDLLVGPQRLEVCPWDEAGPGAVPVLRDYYIARSPQAGLLWVFQARDADAGPDATDGAAPRWFVHGFFG